MEVSGIMNGSPGYIVDYLSSVCDSSPKDVNSMRVAVRSRNGSRPALVCFLGFNSRNEAVESSKWLKPDRRKRCPQDNDGRQSQDHRMGRSSAEMPTVFSTL